MPAVMAFMPSVAPRSAVSGLRPPVPPGAPATVLGAAGAPGAAGVAPGGAVGAPGVAPGAVGVTPPPTLAIVGLGPPAETVGSNSVVGVNWPGGALTKAPEGSVGTNAPVSIDVGRPCICADCRKFGSRMPACGVGKVPPPVRP